MKQLKSFKNLNFEAIANVEFDLGLFACGYEKRCTNILNMKLNLKTKCVFVFKETEGKIFEDNLSVFKKNDFEIHSIGKKSFDKIIRILNEWTSSLNLEADEGREIKVFIDYSSMTRYWYATIINFFKYSFYKKVEIVFGYSEPYYEKTELVEPEIEIESLDFLSHITYFHLKMRIYHY